MQNATVLVIDDSATIRRLVNNVLNGAGYQVLLAPTAEEGVQIANEQKPDLIILDHQLPGTTGTEVCRQLLASDARTIPVIASSTLRKQAYVEYADCSNVIDMLPKPYNDELLKSTVEHALETGHMVVDSQEHGTAVPEVINQINGCEFSGTFKKFTLREVLDFLNNGQKTGVLEIEAASWRCWFHLDKGRIQAVTATGIDISIVTESLNDSLSNLAPVLKLAMSGKSGAELEGLVHLLNNKVLDPRLLKKLMRHQAASLAYHCFTSELKEFRFEDTAKLPPLFRDLPIDTSVLALLVDGALQADSGQLPRHGADTVFARRAIRGQNLDRAGLSPRHQKLVSHLSRPYSVAQLTQQLGWPAEEIICVLHALCLADLVETQANSNHSVVVLMEPNQELAKHVKQSLARYSKQIDFKVVRDKLSVQLIFKRESPDAVILPSDAFSDERFVTLMKKAGKESLRVIPVFASDDPTRLEFENHLTRPYNAEQIAGLFVRETKKTTDGGDSDVSNCLVAS